MLKKMYKLSFKFIQQTDIDTASGLPDIKIPIICIPMYTNYEYSYLLGHWTNFCLHVFLLFLNYSTEQKGNKLTYKSQINSIVPTQII